MITMLKGWEGPVEVNGQKYESIGALISVSKPLSGSINIKLLPKQGKGLVEGDNRGTRANNKPVSTPIEHTGSGIYRITVKKYMTEPSSPGFDFMAKWNNDKPMPLRTMTGKVIQETKGMVKMQLKGLGEQTCTCMRCGRTLTNPISKLYGIGPECMSKLGLVRDIEDVEGIKEDLVEISWEGWVIKSAIIDKEEI